MGLYHKKSQGGTAAPLRLALQKYNKIIILQIICKIPFM